LLDQVNETVVAKLDRLQANQQHDVKPVGEENQSISEKEIPSEEDSKSAQTG